MSLPDRYKELLIILFFSSVISIFFMWKTFYAIDGVFHASLHMWQDFSAHISLVRSFSYGNNWPPQYPLFPGEPIQYHFLFYLLAGMLEKSGFSLVWAINLISCIGLTSLLTGIYFLAKRLFQSSAVGVLSLIFFLFNSSFSWLYYLFDRERFPTLFDIFQKGEYGSVGPYDGNLVSIFWNLNVYLNQRHFGFALALFFLAYFSIVVQKKNHFFLLGILSLFLLSWTHKAVWLFSVLLLFLLSVKDGKLHKQRFITVLIGLCASLPAWLILNSSATSDVVSFKPGFLYERVNWTKFPDITLPLLQWVVYWIVNWGMLPIVALGGWLVWLRKSLAKYRVKDLLLKEQSIWFLTALLLFIASNVFRFSTDLVNNHKFLNITQIIWSMFAGFYIVKIFEHKKIFFLGYILVVLMTLGGLMDFFPTFFAKEAYWFDIHKNQISQQITETVPVDTVVLNTSYLTEPISITGRKVFYGYDIYAWAQGYDVNKRKQQLKPFLLGELSVTQVCEFVQQHDVYLIYSDKTTKEEKFADVIVNYQYLDKIFPDYQVKIDDKVSFIYIQSACTQGNKNSSLFVSQQKS